MSLEILGIHFCFFLLCGRKINHVCMCMLEGGSDVGNYNRMTPSTPPLSHCISGVPEAYKIL